MSCVGLPKRRVNIHSQTKSSAIFNLDACTNAIHIRITVNAWQAAMQLEPASFSLQNTANIANAMARLDFQPPALVEHLQRCLGATTDSALIPQHAGDVQIISSLLNAFARAGIQDAAIFRRLSVAVQQTPEHLLSPQCLAIVANSHAKVKLRDMQLLKFVSRSARALPASSFSAQNSANIVNAFSKLLVADAALFRHMMNAVLLLPRSAHSLQSISNTLNAYADALESPDVAAMMTDNIVVMEQESSTGIRDVDYNLDNTHDDLNAQTHEIVRLGEPLRRDELSRLVSLLSDILMTFPASSLYPLAVTIVLSAFAKLDIDMKPDLLRHLLSSILLWNEDLASPNARPNSIDGWTISAHILANMLNSLARLGVQDKAVYAKLSRCMVRVGSGEWGAVGVAQACNAFARVDHRDDEALGFLSKEVLQLPADTFTVRMIMMICFVLFVYATSCGARELMWPWLGLGSSFEPFTPVYTASC
jgi:hypothetical protein